MAVLRFSAQIWSAVVSLHLHVHAAQLVCYSW